MKLNFLTCFQVPNVLNFIFLKKQLFCFFVLLLFCSCDYPELNRNEIIYFNDFNDTSIIDNKIDGYSTTTYNNEIVLGNFNNDGFTLNIPDVGSHDYITVSFDLYIHGSWDGNANGFSENDRADKWTIELKPDMELHKDPFTANFTTTFSNSPCYPNYCLKQSYPENYPFDNIPKKGSYKVDLIETCTNSFFGGKTTLYRIEKTFKSSGNDIILRFFDELYQPNAIDKDGIPQQKCDESWSIDNLRVRAIEYR